MKIIIQRVKEASVSVNNNVVGNIDLGFMILVGVTLTDTFKDVDYLVNKVLNLRVFEDIDSKLNRSIVDVKGSILSVSQFTLYGDVSKGNRPSFTKAANRDLASSIYNRFNIKLIESNINVKTGVFGEHMEVSLINDGPVTIIIESK